MIYRVYFELYGKKMRTDIFASSEEHAQRIVQANIKFHKVEEIAPEKSTDEQARDIMDFLMGGRKI